LGPCGARREPLVGDVIACGEVGTVYEANGHPEAPGARLPRSSGRLLAAGGHRGACEQSRRPDELSSLNLHHLSEKAGFGGPFLLHGSGRPGRL